MQPLDLMLLAAAAAAFWLLIVRPSRQRRTAQEALVAGLRPGRRVMTAAGVFGTVVSLDGDRVRVEIAPGVVIEMLQQAVARLLDDPTEPGDTAGAAPGAADWQGPGAATDDDVSEPTDDHRDGDRG